MKKINFTKIAASGNDFIVIDRVPFTANRLPILAKKMCDRKFGVGADGVLLLEKSKIADIRMHIFNADGSEAEMCGNGARCTALYYVRVQPACRQGRGSGFRGQLKIETMAGIIEGKVSGNNVKIKLTDPKEYQSGVPIRINEREIKIHSINTGVPHAVIFAEGIEEFDVSAIGRQVRYYDYFAPAGTNVNFVEIVNNDTIRARTYERGVEDETLACGTGAVASAIVYSLQFTVYSLKNKINVITRGGEILKVYFERRNDTINNVWFEGKAKIVYRGEIVI
jgi:diaminopimelate epimerase